MAQVIIEYDEYQELLKLKEKEDAVLRIDVQQTHNPANPLGISSVAIVNEKELIEYLKKKDALPFDTTQLHIR